MNGAKNTLRTLTTNLVKRTNSIGPVSPPRSRSSSAVSPPLSRKNSGVNLNITVTTNIDNTMIRSISSKTTTPDTKFQLTNALSGGAPVLKNSTMTSTNNANLPSNSSQVNLTEQREYSTGINVVDDNMEYPCELEQGNKLSILAGLESGGIEYFQLPSTDRENAEKGQNEEQDFMIGMAAGGIEFFQMPSMENENLKLKGDENENNFYMNTEYDADESMDNNYWITPSQSTNVSVDEDTMVVFSVDKSPSTVNTSVNGANPRKTSDYSGKYMQPNNNPSNDGLALGVIDFIGMPREI